MQQLFDSQSLAPNDFAKFKAGAEAARQQHLQALAGEAVARRNLEDGTLKAPVAGYIARRMLEPGAMAAPGQPVFEIAAMDPLEVSVGVPETDIHLVKVGQAAEVRVPALPGRTFKGLVKVVGIAADPATRTFLTRVTVPNPGRDLKVGMVAEVAITGSGKVDLTLVPVEAVVHDPQGATLLFQYFPDQRRVYSRRIEVGAVYGQEVAVKAGLKGDESIVVSGQHALRNGMAAAPAESGRR
jgi:RND family efflux transporter MFP subunit